MKKTYYLLFVVLFSFCLNTQTDAQVFFTEDFEGTMNATTNIPNNWTETSAAATPPDGIYDVGDNLLANSAGFWPVPAHTLFAQTNDDACGNTCDKSDDKLILPMQDFTPYASVNLIADLYMDGQYSATGFVEVSTDNGATWTSVYTMPTQNGTWQDSSVINLNAYAGQDSILLAFRFNDQAAWSTGLAVDNVSLVGSTANVDDLSAASAANEYTLVPRLIANAMDLELNVDNLGTSTAPDVIVTANIFYNGSFLSSTSSAPASINAGQSALLNAGTLNAPNNGPYAVQYIVSSATLSDVNALNDTLVVQFFVDEQLYARDNGQASNSVGVGANTTATTGNTYEVTTQIQLDSVWVPLGGVLAGDTTRFVIYDCIGNTPNVIIGQSAEYVVTAADTVGGLVLLQLPVTDLSSNALVLNPGTYFLAVEEYFTTNNYGIYVSQQIVTPNKGSYVNINGGNWIPLESAGVGSVVAMIRGIFSQYCAPTVSNASSTDASCGAADGSATVAPTGGLAPYTYAWDASAASQTTATATGLNAGTYVVVYTDSFGCANTDSVSVSNANAPTLGITVANSLDCDDSANGVLNAIDSGGTGTVTFQWGANANSQTAQSASGLTAGSYSVTATDAAGCTVTATYVLVAPDSIAVVPDNIANVSCFGGTDGAIEVTTLGGTPTYTYLWSNGATTEDLVGIPAGLYSGTITDANGCTFSAALPITEPTQLVASATDLGNGQAANANGTGGTPPYSFQWDAAANNQTAQTASNLTPGTYSVTVTDANGCSDDTTVTILATNINTIEGIGSLNMFPNPANAEVIVDIQLEQNMDVAIRVMNVTGQTMIETQLGVVETQRAVLDIRQLTSGVYTVQINIGTEVISKKLIVSKQ